ncbi:MAG: GerAB/ArcD/ProY family transporter [Deltaproteobacteria bacterium]
MENRPISSQQFAAMTFLLLIGSVLVYVPGNAAGQNAWIATLLGAIPGLFVLYAVLQLQAMFPEQRITQVSTQVLGKIPGTILNILFYWSIFIYTAGLLYEIVILLTIIYPAIPNPVLFFIIILTCVYCLYQGLNVMGRLGELFVWLCLFFIIIGVLFSLPLVDLSKLKPLIGSWKPLLAGSIYSADWPFDLMVIWGLFLPMVSSIKENTKKIYTWYLISAVVLVILDVQTLSILGPDITKATRFPLFEIYRLVGFGEFKRLELTFLVLWLISGITPIIILYQGMNFIMQDILRLKSYKPLILPTGLCLGILTLYMFPSDIPYMDLGFKYIPAYTFPVNLLYPAIILVAAIIQQKRSKSKSTPGSAPARPGRASLPETRPR